MGLWTTCRGYELGSGSGSSYPTTLDTDSTVESNSTIARKDVPNDSNSAILKIETELGVNPSGGCDNVADRFGLVASTINPTFTGTITINGNVTQGSGAYTATWSSSTTHGTSDINGLLTCQSITMDSGAFSALLSSSTIYGSLTVSGALDFPAQSVAGADLVNDSVTDTQLAYNTGQHLTTTSSPTFKDLVVTYGLDTSTGDFSGAVYVGGNITQGSGAYSTSFSSTNINGSLTVSGAFIGAVDDIYLSTSVAHIDEAQTIIGNWVNTANPWADNEVSDTLTASDLVAGSSVVSNAEVDDDITLTNITQITTRNHDSLAGLTDDDHTIYYLVDGSRALPENSVGSYQIINGTITSTDILDGSIIGVDIATGAVDGSDILDKSISGLDFADDIAKTTTGLWVFNNNFTAGQGGYSVVLSSTTVYGSLLVTGSVTATIDDVSLSTSAAHIDEAQTIIGNWVNTANPWADNEVSDTLTASSLSITNQTKGSILYFDGSNWVKLSSGTAGQYLETAETPLWSAPSGSGDMLKSTYDSDADGKISGANIEENEVTSTQIADVITVDTITASVGIVSEQSIKGWVVFVGSGTVTITDKYNVTSITDNGVGDYTITWSVPFASPEYCVVATCIRSGSGSFIMKVVSQTASVVRVGANNQVGDAVDPDRVYVMAIGDR